MSENQRHARADQFVARFIAPLLFVVGTLLILYFTLREFDFYFGQFSPRTVIDGFIFYPSTSLDFLLNVLLFIPFGFGLSAILDARGWPARRVLLAVVLAGFLLSLSVESLQNFLPRREPSIADLYANTLSSFLGLGAYRLWKNRSDLIAWLSSAVATPSRMLIGVLLYSMSLLMIAGTLAKNVELSNWDFGYHLLVGSEQAGKRLWRGTVRDLAIFDEALLANAARQVMEDPENALTYYESLLAYYPLDGVTNQKDLTRKQPDLVWQSAEASGEAGSPPQLDGLHWLVTELAVSDLSRHLQQTSQFTIRLTAATEYQSQTGPARIVTISEDTSNRNLTLGQASDALAIRFRSRFTAQNGVSPEILFPGFFTTGEERDFAVIFDGAALSLIDERSTDIISVELVPGAVFYEEISPSLTWYWRLDVADFDDTMYRLFFYACMLVPLGTFIALPVIADWRRSRFLLFFLLCVLIVPFMLELWFSFSTGAEFRPLNMLTAAMVLLVSASSAALLMILWRRLWGDTNGVDGEEPL
jgi:glycopeptide antibiotics resistance protein